MVWTIGSASSGGAVMRTGTRHIAATLMSSSKGVATSGARRFIVGAHGRSPRYAETARAKAQRKGTDAVGGIASSSRHEVEPSRPLGGRRRTPVMCRLLVGVCERQHPAIGPRPPEKRHAERI